MRDALAQIDALGVDKVLCCGDLIDYGLFPEETLTLLRERRVVSIRGNHDRGATQSGQDASGWDLTTTSVAYLVANPGALLRDPAEGTSLPTPGTFGVLTIEHERAWFEVRKARDGSLVRMSSRR